MQFAHDLFALVVSYSGHEHDSDQLLVADIVVDPQLLFDLFRLGVCCEQSSQGRSILISLRATLPLV